MSLHFFLSQGQLKLYFAFSLLEMCGLLKHTFSAAMDNGKLYFPQCLTDHVIFCYKATDFHKNSACRPAGCLSVVSMT